MFLFPGDPIRNSAFQPKHRSWHRLACNRTNPEMLARFALWERADGMLYRELLDNEMVASWATVFGEDALPRDAVGFLWAFFRKECILRDYRAQLCGRSQTALLTTIRRNLSPPREMRDAENRRDFSVSWDWLFCGRPPIEALVDLAFWERLDGSFNEAFMASKDMRRAWGNFFGVGATPSSAAQRIWERFGAEYLIDQRKHYLDGRSLDDLLTAIARNLTPPSCEIR